MLELYNPPPEIATSLESFALGWTYPYAMHWKVPVLVSVAYTLAILRVNPQKPQSIAAHKPTHAESVIFKRLVIAHNILLATFSLWILVSMSTGVISNISHYGWYGGLCDKKFTLWNAKLFRLSYYFYLSKYYEFIDTLIILYKGPTICGVRLYGLYQQPVTYRLGINSSGQWSSWFHTSQFTQIVHRKTHYAVLGISETATPKEIKTAYYELSKRWHPDKNKETANEAHQMFLKISEAYSVLGNERKRRDYDRTLLRTGGPSRWSRGSGGFAPGQGSSMHHHRHRNASAFSSTGEYSSAKRSDEQQQHYYRGWQKPDSSSGATGYQRPQGTYARHSASSGRSYAKSNFEEWERKHYGELKQRAETIGEHARESAKRERYINGQITVYRFWELLTAITIVVAFGLAGRQVLYYLNRNSLSSADTITDGVLAAPGGDRDSNVAALRNRKETDNKEKLD
ncbi:hypothetical protein IWW48_003492 [Coemansia sp. RSA 1200]|nr:hypothetical protein IWW48_003492 [Coemansia sp. RSA 1200]